MKKIDERKEEQTFIVLREIFIMIYTYIPTNVSTTETIKYAYHNQCEMRVKREGLNCNISRNQEVKFGRLHTVIDHVIHAGLLTVVGCHILIICCLRRVWRAQERLAPRYAK